MISNAIVPVVYDRDKIELLKQTVCKGATDDELKLFIAQCQRTGLDPFIKQIYALKRREYDKESGQWLERMAMQVGIDGYRLIAERTGKYVGQLGPYWCGKDGTWKDVWLQDVPPSAAKVGILREGFREPVWGVARYSEYVQAGKEGKPNAMWSRMPANQLSKCAESLALRKCFPQELSGLEPSDDLRAESERESHTEGEIIVEEPTLHRAEPQIEPVPPTEDQLRRAIALHWSKRAHLMQRINAAFPKFPQEGKHLENLMIKLTLDKQLSSKMADDEAFAVVYQHEMEKETAH